VAGGQGEIFFNFITLRLSGDNPMSAQLSIFDINAGIHGRDSGIEAVISSNECFVSTMRGIARIIVRRKGVVTSDDLREIARDHGIVPKHENAWGGIFRGNEWECVGFMKSKLPSNHARTIRTWRMRGAV
jgi:hypothetical protein